MSGQYNNHTGRFLAAIAMNMPEISGDVMQGWIQNPGALKDALRQALCPPATSLKKFEVWMTVEIGGVLKDKLVWLLDREMFFVGDGAMNIIRQDAFTVLPEKKMLKLARCKVRDLGFTKTPTTLQLQNRIKECGCILCPAEVGPHLLRQLKDQPRGDVFWLVMEQITVSYGRDDVFELSRNDDGKQRLDGFYANPHGQWLLDAKVVFVLSE